MDSQNEEYAEEVAIIGEAAFGDTIRDVILRLPSEVAEWVASNITFIDVSGVGACAVQVDTASPSEQRSKERTTPSRLIIVLVEFDEERAEFTVAHEISHHWLGHDVSAGCENYERQEKEADAQANEWGFQGKSIRVA